MDRDCQKLDCDGAGKLLLPDNSIEKQDRRKENVP
jgi:hypothetical protein